MRGPNAEAAPETGRIRRAERNLGATRPLRFHAAPTHLVTGVTRDTAGCRDPSRTPATEAPMVSRATVWALIRGGAFLIAVCVLLPVILLEYLARSVGTLA